MSYGRNHISFLKLISLTIVALCLSPSLSVAQEISQVDFSVEGSKVNITYNIRNCSGNEDYDVRLLLGQNGDLTEIKSGLSGDIEHVSCGSSNTIVWDVLSDREELKGPIFFAVEILRSHLVVTEESPVAYETDDEEMGDDGSAGSVPYGDPIRDQGKGHMATIRPHQNLLLPLVSILQLGVRIAYEQTRSVASHGRPPAVFQKQSGSASSPLRTRRR
ncbi:hypothetical protein WBG78_27720 [Chryseolinea sp. T2]|uniref:hypothetical protein n=1 Tax=Chryseolinea sp. T2 TaxID=3129255 RepID=UPI003077BCEA